MFNVYVHFVLSKGGGGIDVLCVCYRYLVVLLMLVYLRVGVECLPLKAAREMRLSPSHDLPCLMILMTTMIIRINTSIMIMLLPMQIIPM